MDFRDVAPAETAESKLDHRLRRCRVFLDAQQLGNRPACFAWITSVSDCIQDPITVSPDALVSEVLAMIDQKRFDFRTFPVVDANGEPLKDEETFAAEALAELAAAQEEARLAALEAAQLSLHADPVAQLERQREES